MSSKLLLSSQGEIANTVDSPTANSTRTLANYKALAAKSTVNLPGGSTANGTAGTTASSGTDSTASGTSTSTSSAATGASTGAATAIKPSEALTLGGLLALGMALFI